MLQLATRSKSGLYTSHRMRYHANGAKLNHMSRMTTSLNSGRLQSLGLSQNLIIFVSHRVTGSPLGVSRDHSRTQLAITAAASFPNHAAILSALFIALFSFFLAAGARARGGWSYPDLLL